jgi:hypothetical protein
MSKSFPVVFFCVVVFSCVPADAQATCPTGVESNKLICLIPQVYGPNGLVLASTGGGSNFQTRNFSTSSLQALGANIGQSLKLPVASPASGFTYIWDPATQTAVRSTDSFGPILGERAETIGRHKVSLAFTYEYFKLQKLDGRDLKDLPSVFPQSDDSVDVVNPDGSPRTCSVDGDNQTECGFIRDVIKTQNRVNLTVNQFTTFMSYGPTNSIDISLAVPIQVVRMGITSRATIVDNSKSGLHTFDIPPDGSCGQLPPNYEPCREKVFSDSRSASGIGDMTLRVKGTVSRGEHAAVALGVDVLFPTGDALNFLGSGAYGVRPFAVVSYGKSRFSPHGLLGYEANGNSKIAGDISRGTTGRLPSRLTYSGGVDVWVTKRLSAAFDVVGQQVFQAPRTVKSTFPELGACVTPDCTSFETPVNDDDLSQKTGSFNISNAALGVRFKVVSNLLVTGNVLLRLNSGGGLWARAVPLIGLSSSF